MWDLIRRHEGRDNPISVAELARITGISDRTVQTVKKQLVELYLLPVGTECKPATKTEPARHGYYVIVDDEDRKITSANLWNRALSTIAQVMAVEQISIEEALHELLQRQQAENACTQGSEPAGGNSRLCSCGCGLSFVPARPWQRFKNTEHQQRHHRAGRQLGLDFLEGVA